jgi:hypothetical protein
LLNKALAHPARNDTVTFREIETPSTLERAVHIQNEVLPQSRAGLAWKGIQITGSLLLGIILLGMTAWGALAVYYSNLSSPTLRTGLSVTFALSVVARQLFVRPRRRAVFGFLVVFTGLLLWWLSIPPSHDRDWQPDVAVLPFATFDGDTVTIHNIRNNDYRSETDYTVRYYDKTFQLSKLRTVDLFLSYWGSPMIAHTIMSFGFAGDDYVAISIEARPQDESGGALDLITIPQRPAPPPL